MCGFQTLEREAMKLKLLWILEDIRDAGAVGYLQRTAAMEPAKEKGLCYSQQR